jgi:hypothetical protein
MSLGRFLTGMITDMVVKSVMAYGIISPLNFPAYPTNASVYVVGHFPVTAPHFSPPRSASSLRRIPEYPKSLSCNPAELVQTRVRPLLPSPEWIEVLPFLDDLPIHFFFVLTIRRRSLHRRVKCFFEVISRSIRVENFSSLAVSRKQSSYRMIRYRPSFSRSTDFSSFGPTHASGQPPAQKANRTCAFSAQTATSHHQSFLQPRLLPHSLRGRARPV